MPTPAELGADAAGDAASALASANAYTDAAIFAVTASAERARVATLVTIPDLSSVTLALLDPALAPAFLVEGDKVLVLGQASPDGIIPTSAAFAGLYDVGPMVAGVAALTRNTHYNTAAEICGATWFVTDGTHSNDFWACTNDPATTILNTTPLVFVQIAGALSNTPAQALGVAASGTNHDVSRADHVHPMPTAGDVGAMVNPMTTAGDLITGGASGTPGRLGIGSNGTVLTVTAGVPAWAAAASGPALSNATPQPIGTAAAGTSSDAARADHVHAGNTPSELTVPGLVSLAGSVVSYSASPSGVTQERGDTALAERNGIRFWGRGNAKGTIAGTASGLRITTSATDTTQPYPFADGGTSIFVALPTLNEFEVDLYYTLVLTQKATGGDSVNFRAGLMGFLISQSYNCGRIALFSFGGVNSGNPTEEWGFSSAVNSTQASTTTTTNRVARMRRAGGIFEVWGGPDINNLTRRIAQASNTNSQTPLLLTAGVNANGASMVGSYVEFTSIAIRDRWS